MVKVNFILQIMNWNLYNSGSWVKFPHRNAAVMTECFLYGRNSGHWNKDWFWEGLRNHEDV